MHSLPLKHKAKGPGLEFSTQFQTPASCIRPVMRVRFLRRI